MCDILSESQPLVKGWAGTWFGWLCSFLLGRTHKKLISKVLVSAAFIPTGKRGECFIYNGLRVGYGNEALLWKWATSKQLFNINLGLGKLKGKEDVARDGTRYYSFTGVPYAQPPVGDLRYAEEVE